MAVTPPGSQDVVVRRLLIDNAALAPDERYVSFEDGTSWTWRDTLAEANGAAMALRKSGVQQGDRVAVMLPNGADYLRAWWGVAMLGAVVVPVNLAFRGSMLQHLFALARPVALVTDGEHLDRFAALRGTLPDLLLLTPKVLRERSDRVPEIERPIEYHDIHALMLTSGTTGPSKLSATTYRHVHLGGSHFLTDFGCGPQDVFLADLPLFHLGAMYQVMATLKTRTQVVIRTRPDLARYWQLVRDHGVTCGLLLSTMVPYLMAQPPRPSDRDHSLRLLLAAPLPHDAAAFQARFGIARIQTALGSTELPGPLIGDSRDPFVYGYCGRARPGFAVRLVDEHDADVGIGVPGELVVRADHPWSISAGYVGDDAATAAAWRNGWFHSGDTLRCDSEGRYFFVDRVKDAVRRRGENISTAEVEAELVAHPDVLEVACVPFREPDWVDDELKAWIVAAPGVTIDFAALLRFAVDRLPHFMVPRFFEIATEFPKTASTRVQKFALRERGNGAATWDREDHGFLLTRNGLVQRSPEGQAPVQS